MMDTDISVAEALPRAYRALLDAIGELEHRGGWNEAAALRRAAAVAYSAAWNEEARRTLAQLHERVVRTIMERDPLAERRVS